MNAIATPAPPAAAAPTAPPTVGPLGRLGGWTAGHVRIVAIAWALVALALGAFAPKVETALSGAGWQANGSESVQARKLIQANGVEQRFHRATSHSRVVTRTIPY